MGFEDFLIPKRDLPLTGLAPHSYLPKLISKRCYIMNWAGRNEADIQAAQPQAGEQARVPLTHEDGRGSQDPEPTSQSWARAARGADRREVAVEGPGPSERLPREARIRLGSEIQGLLQRGKRKRTKNLDVFFDAAPALRSRMGIIVPKHGHRIVERNLVKRRLREICRRNILPGLEASGRSADLLIRARRAAYEADFSTLEQEVRDAVEGLCSEDS